MIAISDDFKEAIKEKNREIKGYVEVIYLQGNIDGEVSSDGIGTDRAIICEDSNQILTGNRIVTNYASLEQNYFKLDGSFILPNDPAGFENQDTGYISDDIESQYLNKKIKISGSTSDVIIYDNLSVLTVYFKDNIPSTINLKIYYINHNPITRTINNNIDDVVYFEFDEISYITSIEITLDGFMYNNRRIRIPKIEAGLTNVYKDKDLISFTTTEQISEFNVETPIDECDLIIDNYDNKFDIMNSKGLIKYLNNEVQIKPFIGIVTESNGVEYVPMGIYYLQNYTNNSDKTTTFHCEKNFKKLSTSSGIFRTYVSEYYNTNPRKYFETLCDNYGIENYTFDVVTTNNIINDMYFPLSSKLEQLNNFAIFTNSVIRNGRNNDVIIENINNDLKDTLLLSEMKTIPEYNVKNVLKSITMNITDFNRKDVGGAMLFNGTINVSKENPFILKFNTPLLITREFTPELTEEQFDEAEIIEPFYFFNTNKLEGQFNLNISVSSELTRSTVPYTFNYNNDGTEIEIDSVFYNYLTQYAGLTPQTAIKNTADFIENNYKKYDIKIDYFGNPAYETNDVLKIETPYGYKTMRILKHSLTFNGALSGTIEGVGD
jgi:hypothetical protein